jgi:predicted  nucleic acid-binding Zn-ribbon protein
MPYHKDKQQAFQAAQQGFAEADDVYNELVKDGASYGKQLAHLKEEVQEAYLQIENALEVASEHQRVQLQQYQRDLQSIVNEINNLD